MSWILALALMQPFQCEGARKYMSEFHNCLINCTYRDISYHSLCCNMLLLNSIFFLYYIPTFGQLIFKVRIYIYMFWTYSFQINYILCSTYTHTHAYSTNYIYIYTCKHKVILFEWYIYIYYVYTWLYIQYDNIYIYNMIIYIYNIAICTGTTYAANILAHPSHPNAAGVIACSWSAGGGSRRWKAVGDATWGRTKGNVGFYRDLMGFRWISWDLDRLDGLEWDLGFTLGSWIG